MVGTGEGVTVLFLAAVADTAEGNPGVTGWQAAKTIKINRQMRCFMLQLYQEDRGLRAALEPEEILVLPEGALLIRDSNFLPQSVAYR